MNVTRTLLLIPSAAKRKTLPDQENPTAGTGVPPDSLRRLILLTRPKSEFRPAFCSDRDRLIFLGIRRSEVHRFDKFSGKLSYSGRPLGT